MASHSNISTTRAVLTACSALILCAGIVGGCGKPAEQGHGRAAVWADSTAAEDSLYPGDPLDLWIAYDVTEDKSRTEGYYQTEWLKEWYTARVQPPPFDFAMDLSGKNYLELRLLRYSVFARNGYLFKDAALRWYFNQFPWYQPVFGIAWFRTQINAQEKAFVDRVAEAEAALLRDRHVLVQADSLVNLDHVVNLTFSGGGNDSSRAAFRTMNMAIRPSTHGQLFYVYDENQYGFVPNFITTDLYAQTLHKYLGSLMKGIEDSTLIGTVHDLLWNLRQKAVALARDGNDSKVQDAAEWADAYLAVGLSSLAGSAVPQKPTLRAAFAEEFGKVLSGEGKTSPFLNRVIMDYSRFIPRGNYTDTDVRKGYFRCYTWLSAAPMNIDDDPSFMAALLMAFWIQDDVRCRAGHDVMSGVITLLAGEEDGLSLGMITEVLTQKGIQSIDQMLAPAMVADLRQTLKAMNVGRIDPKAANDTARIDFAKKAILFTAGRYNVDGEALLHTVHVARPEQRRPFPRGLDVFAAMGNATAESILNGTYQESKLWPAYMDSLAVAKATFDRYDRWDASLYGKMLQTIRLLSTPAGQNVPFFMRTASWRTKELNTSLAAWTELKHDMVLYAEQPYAAEAGEGGGPEPPMHLSYVEPNTGFWSGAIALLERQEKALASLGALAPDAAQLNHELKDLATFLLSISRKELAGERVTEKEFHELTWIGGKIESLTFRIFGSDHLPEREKQIALVTDVYSYNGRTLEEAVGHADEIFVVAEINGVPYLTRGACFSYYEFQSDKRLTNDEWQEMLASGKAPARPEWMQHLLLQSDPWKRAKGADMNSYIDRH